MDSKTQSHTCPECQGTGQIEGSPCSKCGGSGRTPPEPGTERGQVKRHHGLGTDGLHPGDPIAPTHEDGHRGLGSEGTGKR